jgi:hypothetical protein
MKKGSQFDRALTWALLRSVAFFIILILISPPPLHL